MVDRKINTSQAGTSAPKPQRTKTKTREKQRKEDGFRSIFHKLRGKRKGSVKGKCAKKMG